jgi:hypothetical protein
LERRNDIIPRAASNAGFFFGRKKKKNGFPKARFAIIAKTRLFYRARFRATPFRFRAFLNVRFFDVSRIFSFSVKLGFNRSVRNEALGAASVPPLRLAARRFALKNRRKTVATPFFSAIPKGI